MKDPFPTVEDLFGTLFTPPKLTEEELRAQMRRDYPGLFPDYVYKNKDGR